MPHLSPMNWLIMLITMISFLYIMNSSIWWKTTTPMKQMSTSKTLSSKPKWPW